MRKKKHKNKLGFSLACLVTRRRRLLEASLKSRRFGGPYSERATRLIVSDCFSAREGCAAVPPSSENKRRRVVSLPLQKEGATAAQPSLAERRIEQKFFLSAGFAVSQPASAYWYAGFPCSAYCYRSTLLFGFKIEDFKTKELCF